MNAVDGNYRSCCVIVTGVPEDNITSLHTNENAQPATLSTDHDKVKVLLKLTENSYFTEDNVNDFQISRLGKVRQGANRAIKITLPAVQDRNESLKGSSKLKSASEPWKRIFIKKTSILYIFKRIHG